MIKTKTLEFFICYKTSVLKVPKDSSTLSLYMYNNICGTQCNYSSVWTLETSKCGVDILRI